MNDDTIPRGVEGFSGIEDCTTDGINISMVNMEVDDCAAIRVNLLVWAVTFVSAVDVGLLAPGWRPTEVDMGNLKLSLEVSIDNDDAFIN